VPLGGFLGAGKTSLMLAAARVLGKQGVRVAAVLNDQGSDLVDTHLVRENQVPADQVTGGCFCCRFSDLVDALERLRQYQPEVVFAEAVGSCTDLSATTLEPLRRSYGERFRLAPFSVLVDPARARDLLATSADADLAFLFRNQLAEADLVCFTKADLASDLPEMPGLPVRSMSAKTGQGVAEWLHEILAGEIPLRNTILEIDYGRYAQAEAALAWLNCRASAHPRMALSPAMLAGPLLDGIAAAIAARDLRIVHLKLMDACATGYIKAGLCGNQEEPRVEGALDAEPCGAHDLLLNIRAVGDPEALRQIVEGELKKLNATVAIHSLECFRPAPPQPQHRVRSTMEP
jgi:Ni2+-binding GTPase involved in maturation of urease and hydrogenase